MKSTSFTPEYLRERFRYDPETGRLYWKPILANTPYARGWNTKYAGREAGCEFSKKNGVRYRHMCLDRKHMSTHRVIWIMVYGYDPDQIDHINGDGLDNRLCNLRDVSNGENSRNQQLRSTNKSGITGVYWDKQSEKWCAEIRVDGKIKRLGRFIKKEDAAVARKEANHKYGYHTNHGRSSIDS